MDRISQQLKNSMILESLERIRGELQTHSDSSKATGQYIEEALAKLTATDFGEVDCNEYAAFYLAAFEHATRYQFFEIKKIERGLAEFCEQINLHRVHGSKQALQFILREVNFHRFAHRLNQGELLVANLILCELLDSPNQDDELQLRLARAALELHAEQGDAIGAQDLLEKRRYLRIHETDLATMLLQEIRVLRAIGLYDKAAQAMQYANQIEEQDPGNMDAVEWEGLWLQLQHSGDIRPLFAKCFGRDQHLRLDQTMEGYLAVWASGKKRWQDKLSRIDSIKRKFTSSENEQCRALTRCAASIEVIWSSLQNNQTTSELSSHEVLKSLFDESYFRLPRQQKKLVLAALLRWSHTQSDGFLIRTIQREFMNQAAVESVGLDTMGLVEDIASSTNSMEPTSHDHYIYVDKIKADIFSRRMSSIKVALNYAGNRLTRFVASVKSRGDEKAAYTTADSKKLVSFIMRECNIAKGPALKAAQIVAAIEGQSFDVFYQSESQGRPTAVHPNVIATVIAEELGDRAQSILQTWNPTPLAAASIGQVHRCRLPDHGAAVIKVQYPGIKDVIRSDLKIQKTIMPLFKFLFPLADVKGHYDYTVETTMQECDYGFEAQTQKSMREFAQEKYSQRVEVPQVYSEFSTDTVLCSEYIDGQPLAMYIDQASDAERNELATLIYRFFWDSFISAGLVMGDPHPGNILIKSDGTVAVVDFGLVAKVSENRRSLWRETLLAILENDMEKIQAGIFAMGFFPESVRDKVDTNQLLKNTRKIFHFDTLGQTTFFGRKEAADLNALITTNAPNRKLMSPQVEDGMIFRFVLVVNILVSHFDANVDWGTVLKEVLLQDTSLSRAS